MMPVLRNCSSTHASSKEPGIRSVLGLMHLMKCGSDLEILLMRSVSDARYCVPIVDRRLGFRASFCAFFSSFANRFSARVASVTQS